MDPIPYVDRQTQSVCYEKVYGGDALDFLYGQSWLSRYIGRPIAHAAARCDGLSSLYGWLQRRPASRSKIEPFLKAYGIDPTEFADTCDSYTSFDAFFTRKLKSTARPFVSGDNVAIMPADARYVFHQDISAVDGFLVKGEKFCLKELLGDEELAAAYTHGTMVMARLCPVDYHRFHFPCSGFAAAPKLINGYLYSVNPIALKQDIHIFTQNKRMVTLIDSSEFGRIAYIEVGATNVGSIHQTYPFNSPVNKGQEKGYFSFGGSFLILLFEKGKLTLAPDLIELSKQGIEIRCLLGQALGVN